MLRHSDFKLLRVNHVCPSWFCWSFDNFLRKLVHNPDCILSSYINKGYYVADIGCGKGYFSIPMAKMVGKDGLVVSIDKQKKMLDGVRKRAVSAGVSEQIVTKLVTNGKITINNQVDFALSFWMLHEVPDKERFLQDVFDMIKVGGKYLIVEPKVHVSHLAYLKSIGIARKIGFSTIEEPPIFMSRAHLMEKTSH